MQRLALKLNAFIVLTAKKLNLKARNVFYSVSVEHVIDVFKTKQKKKVKMSTRCLALRQDSGAFGEWPRKDLKSPHTTIWVACSLVTDDRILKEFELIKTGMTTVQPGP